MLGCAEKATARSAFSPGFPGCHTSGRRVSPTCRRAWAPPGPGACGAPDVDHDLAPVLDVGRQEGQRDAALAASATRFRSSPRRPASPSIRTGQSARGGRRPSTSRPRSRRLTPRSRSAASGAVAPELALAPRHHPAESGLQRRDARAQLVAVQRQARLEAQRVAGAQARRGHARRPPRRPTPRRPRAAGTASSTPSSPV